MTPLLNTKHKQESTSKMDLKKNMVGMVCNIFKYYNILGKISSSVPWISWNSFQGTHLRIAIYYTKRELSATQKLLQN